MHRGRVGRGTDLVTKWYWEIHSVVSPMFPAHPGLGLGVSRLPPHATGGQTSKGGAELKWRDGIISESCTLVA